jgi:hypothetical protein
MYAYMRNGLQNDRKTLMKCSLNKKKKKHWKNNRNHTFGISVTWNLLGTWKALSKINEKQKELRIDLSYISCICKAMKTRILTKNVFVKRL